MGRAILPSKQPPESGPVEIDSYTKQSAITTYEGHNVSIIRMYYTPEGLRRPSHYREAWWDADTNEFVVHHGKVGETGTTTAEKLADDNEAQALLASFAQQNANDQYKDTQDVPHETRRVKIQFKGATPTQVETSNADKFSDELTILLAWRGLGTVEQLQVQTELGYFEFTIATPHAPKVEKLIHEALKATDFRPNRMIIERN